MRKLAHGPTNRAIETEDDDPLHYIYSGSYPSSPFLDFPARCSSGSSSWTSCVAALTFDRINKVTREWRAAAVAEAT